MVKEEKLCKQSTSVKHLPTDLAQNCIFCDLLDIKRGNTFKIISEFSSRVCLFSFLIGCSVPRHLYKMVDSCRQLTISQSNGDDDTAGMVTILTGHAVEELSSRSATMKVSLPDIKTNLCLFTLV